MRVPTVMQGLYVQSCHSHRSKMNTVLDPSLPHRLHSSGKWASKDCQYGKPTAGDQIPSRGSYSCAEKSISIEPSSLLQCFIHPPGLAVPASNRNAGRVVERLGGSEQSKRYAIRLEPRILQTRIHESTRRLVRRINFRTRLIFLQSFARLIAIYRGAVFSAQRNPLTLSSRFFRTFNTSSTGYDESLMQLLTTYTKLLIQSTSCRG